MPVERTGKSELRRKYKELAMKLAANGATASKWIDALLLAHANGQQHPSPAALARVLEDLVGELWMEQRHGEGFSCAADIIDYIHRKMDTLKEETP